MSRYTPLLTRIKRGDLISFRSAAEDLNIFGTSGKKIRFKYFALLDLPDISTSINNKNTIQFKNIDGAYNAGLSTASPPPLADRIDFSESFQNYVMNMETILINDPSYKRNLYQNANERIFFKWLKEIGAIRFINADNTKTTVSNRYLEEKNNKNIVFGDLYERVVKYIGEIDMSGSTYSSEKSGSKEIYIYVPTQNGSTPTILFKTLQDDNYHPGKVIKQTGNANIEYIQGQTNATPLTNAGLRTTAFYDMDTNLLPSSYQVNGSLSNPIWYSYLAQFGPNCYFTDASFTDPDNDEIIRYPSSPNPHYYKRSRLDGIMIDFDKTSYKEIVDNNITSFNEFNSKSNSTSFKFNTLALYYEIYDENDPNFSVINLFGVYFLEDFVNVGVGSSRIQSIVKHKQDNTVTQQGDGYGFRISLKPDSSNNTVQSIIEVSINDYNTFSMQMFGSATQKIMELTNSYEKMLEINKKIIDENTYLRQLVENSFVIEDMNNKIESINDKVDNFISGQLQESLITDLYKKYQEIISGNTSVNLNFTLSLLPKDDLSLTLQNNLLIFENKRKLFNQIEIVNLYTGIATSVKNNLFNIGDYNKLIVHSHNNSQKVANDNVIIYLDDKSGWSNGQSITFYLQDEIDFGNSYGIIIYTDAKNKKQNNNSYETLVGTIANNELKKSFTIVCIDKDNFKFIII
jgi:hypothetical protein